VTPSKVTKVTPKKEREFNTTKRDSLAILHVLEQFPGLDIKGFGELCNKMSKKRGQTAKRIIWVATLTWFPSRLNLPFAFFVVYQRLFS